MRQCHIVCILLIFYAIHGSYEVVPGKNVSHGCIRIYPEAARWLNHNFIDVGTKVIVKPY